MLPETTISVPEIMQTEEVGPDEIPTLNPSPDTEMTVKEEIEHPVELPQKTTNALNECMSTDTTAQLTALDESNCNFDDTVIGHQFNSPFESIRPIPVPLLRDTTLNINLHESAASSSIVSSLVSISTPPSPQQKIEKEKNRGKRRSRWKFHHQALPPEYLDHYQATVAQKEAAAAGKAAAKADGKSKGDGPSAPPKPTAADKADKLLSPPKCFVKVEQEASKYQPPPGGNSNIMDQLQVLPIQALSISDDNDASNKLQEDVSILNAKPTVLCDKAHFSNEKFVSSKGLLGTLLTSTITSEPGSKSAAENERKRKSVIMSTNSGNNIPGSRSPTPSNSTFPSNTKVRNYQDLPYMGEITLDNMKPRRGRKPKKADICHLIYKNYGTTVLPGTPLRSNLLDNEEWSRRKMHESSQTLMPPTSINSPEVRLKQENGSEPSLKCKPLESLKQSSPVSHSDVQNRIISSLLEKRLMTTQDGKKTPYNNSCFVPNSPYLERNDNNLMNTQNSWSENCKPTTSGSDEPLNLCVKDLNQLKIRLLRKHGNFYEPRANDVVIKSEPPSPNNSQEPDVCEPLSECPTKFREEAEISENYNRTQTKLLRSESDNTCEPFAFSEGDCSRTTTPGQLAGEPGTSSSGSLPGGYIYWPSAGVFVHPMALQSQFLYYQKMGAIPLVPITPAESQTLLPSQVNLIPHINSTLSQNPQAISKTVPKKDHKSTVNKTLIPKAFSMMMDTSPKPTTSISPIEVPFSRLKRLAPLGNPPPTTNTPTKRKRSAIFIPPMPSENSSNPTTEVSICKFKFTGGAKPSLQEKKMLSVDSGGNFRYYSGTGDKSMRGYEFFPRETLQQSGSVGATSSEQFLAASTASSNSTVPDGSKPLQLQHLSPKVDDMNVPSGDTENTVAGCVPLNYELQNQSGCVKKKNDNSSKGRNASVSADSERFIPGGKEDELATNSQIRMRRKRKTRKSLAREKLEQTFKEKGFLIQTQQLESAEGATYCKFRQLRKFTRYLFRSWKDYLPGNVREMSVAAGVAGPEASPSSEVGPIESEIDGELSCSNSPTPSFQHISESPKTFPIKPSWQFNGVGIFDITNQTDRKKLSGNKGAGGTTSIQYFSHVKHI